MQWSEKRLFVFFQFSFLGNIDSKYSGFFMTSLLCRLALFDLAKCWFFWLGKNPLRSSFVFITEALISGKLFCTFCHSSYNLNEVNIILTKFKWNHFLISNCRRKRLTFLHEVQITNLTQAFIHLGTSAYRRVEKLVVTTIIPSLLAQAFKQI